jgi:glycosyltransferase involved in cell wall biosynthesis
MNIIDFVLPQIIKRIPNAFFLIIGKNPPSVPYDPRFLKFTGYVSDLTKYLAASDVAILPFSKGGRCKVKILEYLAMGIPVVATKKAAEGLPLRNGVNAMLSDAVDCEFINNVLALYNDSSLYEKISKNGRALSEKYDWRIICNRLFQLYRRLLT